MSYALKGPLAAHFRSVGNRWQTVDEIMATTKLSRSHIHGLFGKYIKARYLERQGEPRQYRIKAEALYRQLPPTHPKERSARMIMITTRFCRKWRVKAPFEATRDNPEAMREWTEMLRAS